MDPRFTALRSTTFFSRRLTRREISEIQATVAALPVLSQHELGQTICEQLGWRMGKGKNRIQLGLRFLAELERLECSFEPTRTFKAGIRSGLSLQAALRGGACLLPRPRP